MIPIKRIEIVIGERHSKQVTETLQAQGLDGWTVVRNVLGAGSRGPQLSDEVTGVSSNHWILVACPADRVEGLLEPLRSLLKRFGGVCLISDAHWLRH